MKIRHSLPVAFFVFFLAGCLRNPKRACCAFPRSTGTSWSSAMPGTSTRSPQKEGPPAS